MYMSFDEYCFNFRILEVTGTLESILPLGTNVNQN